MKHVTNCVFSVKNFLNFFTYLLVHLLYIPYFVHYDLYFVSSPYKLIYP